MPLYVFTCAQEHQTELLRPRDVSIAVCPECGEDATRAEVNRIGFSGFAKTPMGEHDFHQDYRRFTEASSEIDYSFAKRESDTGQKLSSPLFQMAKADMAKKAAAGVTADDIKT